MIGFGTLLNAGAIVVGGLVGMVSHGLLHERHQEILNMTCGVCVMFIGIAGAMRYMLSVGAAGALTSGREMFIVLSLVLGALVGEIINIEHGFECFGEWLKLKTGNAKDRNFVNAFVTASLTVCIGAMAVIGSIQDGIYGDWSILGTKAILDLVIIMVMTCSLGKGSIFSAIPVFVLEGAMTFAARLLRPIMTEAAMANLSLVGAIMIFCVGMNIVWGKKIRVANLLPSLVFAVAAAFLPVAL